MTPLPFREYETPYAVRLTPRQVELLRPLGIIRCPVDDGCVARSARRSSVNQQLGNASPAGGARSDSRPRRGCHCGLIVHGAIPTEYPTPRTGRWPAPSPRLPGGASAVDSSTCGATEAATAAAPRTPDHLRVLGQHFDRTTELHP